jgi:hypothetical protein
LRNKPVTEKKEREVIARPTFPLPYNGEFNEDCCHALRQNNGLYTQCQSSQKKGSTYCKSCIQSAEKNDGIPEYGTIQARQATDIFEYVDPKGRKPVAYTKVMKKYKVSKEQVLAEAGKFNIVIFERHFEETEAEGKRGRPKVEKAPKEVKSKGRPKKSKAVLEISGDQEDLFAAMVADAMDDSDDDSVATPLSKKNMEEKAEKEAKKAERLKEKAEKEEKKEAERLEREAKKAALEEEKAAKEAQRLKEKEEKAEKEAQRVKEKAAKEAQRLKEKEEKAAKEAQRLKEKEEKEAKKEAKKDEKPAVAAAAASSEGQVVKVLKQDGKKYLVSESNIVYDYRAYKDEQEQIVVGRWNAEKQKIEFQEEVSSDSEESEDEYEEEA